MAWFTWLSRRTAAVLVCGLLVILLGAYLAFRIERAPTPPLGPPTIVVTTLSPGSTPEDIQSAVVIPQEQALADTPGLARLRSAARAGQAVVTTEFAYGMDVERLRAEVSARVAGAGLPGNAGAVSVHPLVSDLSNSPPLVVALATRSSQPNVAELGLIAREDVLPRLLTVPGVQSVSLIGEEAQRIVVQVDPAKLAATGTPLDQVAGLIRLNNVSQETGTVTVGNNRIPVTTYHDLDNLQRIKDLIVGATGSGLGQQPQFVRVQDVADVRLESAPDAGRLWLDGWPAVGFVVTGRAGVDQLELARSVQARVNAVSGDLGDRVTLNLALDTTEQTRKDILGAEWLTLIAVAVAVLLVGVLLLSVRALVTAAIALAAAMSSGVAAAYWTDLPLTSVTGAGLALGIALAMAPIALSIESVWRRARQGEPRQTAVWQGTWSVFPAVAALTACALASLIPLVFIQELACQAIRPLLLPLAATVAGAFVITLTLVPALAQLFLSWGEPGRLLGPGRWIGGAAGALASFGVKQRVVGFLAGLAALVAAILLALLIDTAVLPQGREDLLRVELTAAPNTTHATVRQAVLDADRLLAEVAGVRKVLAGAQGALSPLRGNEIDPVLSAPDGLLLVRFSGNASLARRVDMVAAALADIDVVRARIAPIEASEALTQFQVSVLGITDAAARNAAQDLASQLEGVAPPVQIRLLPKPPETSYQVHVDPQSAIQQGLVTATETARQVNQLLSGQRLGSTRIGGEERLDVWLTINPALMNNLDKLRGLPIGSGEATALMSVASVNEAVTPVELFRQDGQPAAIVSGTLLGRDSRNATAILKQANDYEAASGMTVQVSGLPVVERQSLRWLAIAPLISAALVFVIALAVTGSLASGLAVLIGATTAGIAAVMSLITFGRPVDLPAVVGFVLIPCVAAAGGLAFVGAMRRANQRGLPAAEAVQESISERGSALALVTIPSMGAFVVLGLGFVSSGPVLGHASTVIAAGSISAAVLGTIAVAAAYALGAGLKPQRPAPTPPPPHPEPQDGGPPTPAPVA